MLCEHKMPQEIKFANLYSYKYEGWIKLAAGTYEELEYHDRAMHNFSTYCFEGLNNVDDLAEALIDSMDIEAIKHDGNIPNYNLRM
jgi:hypothetical protein